MPFPFEPVHRSTDLNPGEREVLAAILEQQGFRELAAAQLFAAGIRLAPTLDEKVLLAEHAREDLVHFEWVAAIYDELVAGDLLASVHGRLVALPEPRSWLELVIAQFLFERAARFQLNSQRACRYSQYLELVAKLLRAEAVHDALAEITFRDVAETDRASVSTRQEHFDKWLRVALETFIPEGAPFDGVAVHLGFQTQVTAAIMRDYCEALRPAAEKLGVVLPSEANLAINGTVASLRS